MDNKIVNWIIDFLYLSVGVSATVVSIKFSYQFFVYNGHAKFWSMVIAMLYIIFLNLIFEGGIASFVKSKQLRKKKGELLKKFSLKEINRTIRNLNITGYVIIFVWLILASYSIISTVGGQYEQLSKLEIDVEEAIVTIEQVPLIESQIIILDKQKALYKEEIKALQKRLATIEDIEKSYIYKNTSAKNEARLDLLRDRLLDTDSSILSLRQDILSISINNNKIVKGSTYKYFERIIKIPAFIIQFILSFFPSITVDFFAPIGFAMFLFRKRKRA